jgi:hypothetical protein
LVLFCFFDNNFVVGLTWFGVIGNIGDIGDQRPIGDIGRWLRD